MAKRVTSHGPGLITKIILAVALIAAGLLAFLVTAFYIFPLGIFEGRLKESLRENGVILTGDSLSRTFPPGLRAENVALTNATTGSFILKLDEAEAVLDLPGLITGSVRIDLKAKIGEGTVTGDLAPGLKGSRLMLEANGVGIKDIPAATNAGLGGSGSLNGSISFYMPAEGCPTGSARIKGEGLKGDDLKYMGFTLPVGPIEDAGLNAEVKDCRVVIEGFWIDAKELSARLSGEVLIKAPFGSSPIKMTIDLTQKGDTTGKEWMTALLSPYKKSANYYSINVAGTVGSPVAER